MSKVVIYDAEVLPNVFTCVIYDKDYEVYEISPRKNDTIKFLKRLNSLAATNTPMVGFNNVHYDYPVIHYLATKLRGVKSAKRVTHNLYLKSKAIFEDSKTNKFAHTLWDNQCIVPQIDLFKIHHFDNRSKSTSLKRLQFNMRMMDIQEFEIPFDEPIKNSKDLNKLIQYNKHDVKATLLFYNYSSAQIKLREKMSIEQGKSYMNYNDTKIGEEYLMSQLKKVLKDNQLYTTNEYGKRKKITTPRKTMSIKDLIFDDIKFNTDVLKKVLVKLKSMTMYSIKGKFHWSDLPDYVRGLEQIETEKDKHLKKELRLKYHNNKIKVELDDVGFVFGRGGLHASVNNKSFESTTSKMILDVDVSSYYASLGIENNLYPHHLTSAFCPIYRDQKTKRSNFAKGTPENAMLKLSLNGAYGKTNSEYSSLYDPLYTVTTTINGQLLLGVLWEGLRTIKGVELIQVNTDGITFTMDRTRECKQAVKSVCRKWEKSTKLDLESAVYKRMWVRDGNNYISEYADGSLKQKGAYVYKSLYGGIKGNTNVEWHKNHSAMIVTKAITAELVEGIPANKFIINHDDVFDFFLCTNVNKTCRLMIGDGIIPAEKLRGVQITPPELGMLNEQIQRVSRYLITNSQNKLTKIMPPLKNKTNERYIGISVGYNVTIHNSIGINQSINPNDYDINYDYYIKEAEKLLKPLRLNVR